MTFKKYFLFINLIFLSYFLAAQIPNGYYDKVAGKEGFALKTELFFIIDGHTDRGYSALWGFYEVADVRADGFVWDIYSNCDLKFGTDQDAGFGGTTECDKFNREHTFPQSWFDAAAVPRADAHMVLPTDKKVNSERGNFPYGEVSNASYTSSNGSKKGNNNLAGYSGVVFEPVDEFKGDIARIYFYMATRYQSQIDGWETSSTESNIVLNGTEDQVFEDWVIEMLIDWHINDPVSQKEIDRNDAVFNYQGNRNPYIDHPEWVSCIWRNSCGGEENPPLNPAISFNRSVIDFGSQTFGDIAKITSFHVVGEDLNENLKLSLENENFKISFDESSNYQSSLTIIPNQDNRINDSIFIRFNSLENTDQIIESLLMAEQLETNPEPITILAETIRLTNPTLSVEADFRTFSANIFLNELPEPQTAKLFSVAIPEDIVIRANSGFKVSKNNQDFNDSIIYSIEEVKNLNTVFYVNYLPESLEAGSFDGELSIINANEEVYNFALAAEIIALDPIIAMSFVNKEVKADLDQINYEITVYSNRILDSNLSFNVIIRDFNNIFYPAQFLTTPEAAGTSISLTIPENDSLVSFFVKLDTSKLKTDLEKSFTLTIQNSADFKFGEVSSMLFSVLPFESIITANPIKVKEDLIIYPNPVQSQLSLLAVKKGEYFIYSTMGKLMMSGTVNQQESIETESLPAGFYQLRVKAPSGNFSKKFIKQ